jgi:hypothetical protein
MLAFRYLCYYTCKTRYCLAAKQRAFIVSTGRTGTDFFTTLFNSAAIPDAWSLHEPRPAFRARSYQLIGRQHTWFERLYFQFPRQRWHKPRAETWYVETNYHLFAAIPLIREAFPNAWIIHVIRDGRAVVTSWLNKYRYITNNHITPFSLPGDPAQADWPYWNPLQKLSWYWKTVNELVAEQQPDLWLSFEQLFRPPYADLYHMLDQLPLSYYDPDKVKELARRKVNRTQTPFFPSYEQWPRRWQEQFWHIAGPAMQRFGYRKAD